MAPKFPHNPAEVLRADGSLRSLYHAAWDAYAASVKAYGSADPRSVTLFSIFQSVEDVDIADECARGTTEVRS